MYAYRCLEVFVDYTGGDVCKQSCVCYSAVDSNWSPTDDGYLRQLAMILMKTSEIVADVTA